LAISSTAFAQQVRIIPEPVAINPQQGVFHFRPVMDMSVRSNDPAIQNTARQFAETLREKYGIFFSREKQPAGIVINIDSSIKNEGYRLQVRPRELTVYVKDGAGLFYSFQTIKQLLPVSFNNAWKEKPETAILPCVDIEDYPRYAYRGMQLDVSRHFFPKEFIKKYIDILAAYKINTFHWHLTDSHGWRLEIKRYPKLTSVGAWRAARPGIPMTIAQPTQPGETADYGGFYTQEEVKEIIRYAQDRFITIIPEIEMPGHCTAALVAYNQYSDLNNGVPLLMPCGYPGDLQHNFCVGYDSTYVFLNNILEEVMDLFPSQYIHIGGDEVRGGPWLNCPRCQKVMAAHGYTTAMQLQGYFTRRIDSFIAAHGKRTTGWEEILSENVSASAVGMVWHQQQGAVDHVKKGYDVVMTPYHYTYFDFYQSDPRLEENITYAPLYLDTVYAFEPAPAGITDEESKHILGVQACLWTENVATAGRVEYMLLPRLLALAEVGWSPPSKKSYPSFIRKVENEFRRFDKEGIQYATSLYNVSIMPVHDTVKNIITVTLADQTHLYPVYYTLDGTAPSSSSKKYKGPFTITKGSVVKAATFDGSRQLGKVNIDTFLLHKATASSIVGDEGNALGRLTDGIYGTVEPYDGRWVSFTDSVVVVLLDLGRNAPLRTISLKFMEDQVGNVFLPASVELFASADNKQFKKIHSVVNKEVPEQLLRHVKQLEASSLNTRARFIRIVITNANLSPERQKNIMLLDEITVQ
jgi:hexosaminidase